MLVAFLVMGLEVCKQAPNKPMHRTSVLVTPFADAKAAPSSLGR
jgi:hypothetical protein